MLMYTDMPQGVRIDMNEVNKKHPKKSGTKTSACSCHYSSVSNSIS